MPVPPATGDLASALACRERDSKARGDTQVRPTWSAIRGSPEPTRIAPCRASRGLRSDLVDPAIAAHHGRVVKRTGDGSIIEFQKRGRRGALRDRECRTALSSATPFCRMSDASSSVTASICATWSKRADGDLMGDGVNIAARLEGIAEPGAICLSEDAYRQK